jgi:hypothetical protein
MMFPNRKTAMAIETPARRLRRFLATFETRGAIPLAFAASENQCVGELAFADAD